MTHDTSTPRHDTNPHNQHAAPEKIRSPAALSLAPVALAAASATAQVTPRLVSREVHELSFHLRSRTAASEHRIGNSAGLPFHASMSESGQPRQNVAER